MKAILVGIWNREVTREEAKDSIRELKGLVEALGGVSVGYVLQKRNKPDVRYFVGAGKANQLKEVAKGTGADAVIFDDFLTPSQVKNLEKLLGRTVLDRTDLVIEIFSRRAKSKEAKLQVELARLTHELPRLYGKGKQLSRLGGGIGTRGPGEQEAEIRRRRRHQRKRRAEGNVVKVALVGYTNAGKSTLLKVLTGRDTFVADMPFATLDTKTSSRVISPELKLLFTDTVGFIKKLPPELIESFKATLEEVTEADLILHVVDISDDRWLDYIHTVKEVLKELGADEKPVIYVLNKADRIVDSEEEIRHLPHTAFVEGPSVIVSAERRWGLGNLIDTLKEYGEKVLENSLVEEAKPYH